MHQGPNQCKVKWTWACMYVCMLLKFNVSLHTYVYVFVVIHTSQRMNLKHPNLLELLGVMQGSITYLVMPNVQRRSIQVYTLHGTLCNSNESPFSALDYWPHCVMQQILLPHSVGHPQLTFCAASWSRVLHAAWNLPGWWPVHVV